MTNDRSALDPCDPLAKSFSSKQLLEWRRDPGKREALRRFPGRKVRELVAIVERGPGFRDDEASQRFGADIRGWARLWIAGGWAVPKPEYRQGAKARITGVAKAAAALARAVGELDPGELRTITRDVAWLLRDHDRVEEPAYLARVTPEVREAVQKLNSVMRNEQRAAHVRATLRALPPALANAAGRVAGRAKVSTRFPDRRGLAFRDLAILWQQSTGRKPTLTYRSVDGSRGGAFPDFARSAMHALWPDAGDLDGLIRKACTEPIRGKR